MQNDMTEGAITPKLIKFTIPLVLGNLFQLTYNAIDTIIVGRYVGKNALAAVGSSGPIMNMAILFISGMCMGAGILMSSKYGAKKYDELNRQISTTMIGGLIFSIVLSLIMFIIAKPVLVIMNVPDEILYDSSVYLKVVFAGLIFTFIYNFFSQTMRALGDSKTPLYFLIISSVINAVGDLFFVVTLNMGVFGSAISTVLSELISCILCIIYVKYKIPLLHLGKKWLVFEKSIMVTTFRYSITSALQQMCVQLGKVVVQVVINAKGPAFIAAYTAINKIDDFTVTPQQNIAHAMTTFIAQNRGAGEKEREREGFKCGIKIELAYSLILCIVTYLCSDMLMRLFVKSNETEVISLGVSYLKLISVMYFLPGITNGVQGFFRGIGDLKVTLYSTMTNMFFRALSAYIFISLLSMKFNSLALANMTGWIFMLIFELPLLFKCIKTMSHTFLHKSMRD